MKALFLLIPCPGVVTGRDVLLLPALVISVYMYTLHELPSRATAKVKVKLIKNESFRGRLLILELCQM